MSDIFTGVRGILKKVLDQHIRAVFLIDRYGTLLTSVSDMSLPKETLSKLCAVLFGSSERLGENLGKGSPRCIAIEYDGMGVFMVRTMSGKYIIIGVADKCTEDVRFKLEGVSVKL
ncbi:MAG: roadblock/LC7 domain-containing protein [Thermoprotei archaeon]